MTSKGLTLVEVLLSLLMIGLLVAALRGAVSAAFKLYSSFSRSPESAQSETAFFIIQRDIRSAASDFIGRPINDRTDEVSMKAWTTDEEKITLKVEGKDLWRQSEKTGRRTFLLSDVVEFKLRYFDGNTWRDHWGWDFQNGRPFEGIHGLPIAVSVRIQWKNKERKAVAPVMTALLNESL